MKIKEKNNFYIDCISDIGTDESAIKIYNNILSEEKINFLKQYCEISEYNSGSKDPKNFWYKKLISYNDIDKKVLEILLEVFNKARDFSIQEYGIDLMPLDISSFNIAKWAPSTSMHLHTDDKDYYDYNIAALLYINDDYIGGEINFPKFNKKIKPNGNTLILFPGHFPYEHEVKTIIYGNRYTSSIWLNFDEKTNE
jgi:hypothetical protein